jgi:hypothetical protein
MPVSRAFILIDEGCEGFERIPSAIKLAHMPPDLGAWGSDRLIESRPYGLQKPMLSCVN